MSKELMQKIKLPLLLLAVIALPLIFGSYIPVSVKAAGYALSLSMKAVLEFILPFVIFSFVFSCLSNLQQGALFFVFLLIVTVFISNFCALMFGYFSGYLGLSLFHISTHHFKTLSPLIPAWQLHITKLISNDRALLLGFVTGIFFSLKPFKLAQTIANRLNTMAHAFLKKAFIPVLPLFILGFVFKLEHEQILQTSLTVYGPILGLIILSQWVYLFSWYFFASKFSWRKFVFYLRNVLPASIVGFTTISSAAAMPVLLGSTEKNLNNSQQAKILVPSIINIHTIGSAIGVPILSLATLLTFGEPLPSLSVFVIFALYTALAKYAVAAVPGGVIIVVAPLLEAHLGFSSEMVGIITAVYLLCDPFGTIANVTGNGVFPILFSKLHDNLRKLIPVFPSSSKTKGLITEE